MGSLRRAESSGSHYLPEGDSKRLTQQAQAWKNALDVVKRMRSNTSIQNSSRTPKSNASARSVNSGEGDDDDDDDGENNVDRSTTDTEADLEEGAFTGSMLNFNRVKYNPNNREDAGLNSWTVGGKTLEEEEEDDDVWFSLLIGDADLEVMEVEAQKNVEMHRWARFDIFFGIVTLTHSVISGLILDKRINLELRTWFLIETGIVVIFVIELLIRFIYAKSKLEFFKDHWNLFDLAVIIASMIDLWIAPLVNPQIAQSSSAPIFRVFRMLRLARLVRLSVMMKELWLLVCGLVESLASLFWMLLTLLFTVYIFALLTYEIIGQSNLVKNNIHLRQKWGNITRSMLSLMQIATYDDWANLVREILFGPNNSGNGMPVFLIIIVPFITLVSLGLLNLIIGVMLTTALQVGTRDSKYKENVSKMRRHQALLDLRRALVARCAADGDIPVCTLSSDKVILQREIARKLRRERIDRESLTSAPMNVSASKHKQLTEIAQLFRNAGISDADIHAVYDEIDSVIPDEDEGLPSSKAKVGNAGRKFRGISVGDFIKGCMWLKGKVHPLDVLHVMAGLKSISAHYTMMTHHLDEAVRELKETCDQVTPILNKWHNLSAHKGHHHTDDQAAPTQEFDPSPESAVVDLAVAREEDVNQPDELEREQSANEAWARFDGCFSSVAVLNAIVLGLQTSLPTVDHNRIDYFPNYIGIKRNWPEFIWFLVESAFLVIYSTELFLRICLYYQIKMEWSYDFKNYVVPKVCYTLSFDKLVKVIKCAPQALADWFVFLDLVILVLAVLDTWVIQMIYGGQSTKGITTLRIFRLLRVLRLLRLFYLIRDLANLVSGMGRSLPLLFWAMVMLLLVIFMTAVVVVEFSRGTSLVVGPTKKYWGSLQETMLTLAGIATYDDWVARLMEVNKVIPGMKYLFLLFVTVTGFGIVNLVIGMMVQAAFGVVQQEKEDIRKKTLADVKEALHETKAVVWKKLKENHEIEKEDKQAKANKKKAQKSRVRQSRSQKIEPSTEGPDDSENEDAPNSDESRSVSVEHPQTMESKDHRLDMEHLTLEGLTILLNDEALIQKLQSAQIRVDQVLMIFQKLDVFESGSVKMNEFIEGLMRMKQRVEGIDVATAKSWARRIVEESFTLQKDAKECNTCFRQIIESLRGVKFVDAEQKVEQQVHLQGATQGFEDLPLKPEVPVSMQGASEAPPAMTPTMQSIQRMSSRNTKMKQRLRSLNAQLELRREELCTLEFGRNQFSARKLGGDAVFCPADPGED